MTTWINKTINYTNLFKSYDQKYGATSDFSNWQHIIFSDNEVQSGLKRALNSINLDSGNILDIGINNAFEIKVMRDLSSLINWKNIKITGIDLSKSALKKAKNNLKGIKHRLLLGNILEFFGQDIKTDEQISLKNKQFDLCLAITSLQSSGIVRNNFNVFMNNLIKKMKRQSSFLIMVPNCYIENGQLKDGGAFDAETGLPNKGFAPDFIKKTASILRSNDYNIEVFGDKFLFILAKRYAKK